MLKIANQVIDAYDDVHKDTLIKTASKRPDCYMLSLEERGALKDHDFALSVITKKASKLNKFPINSADSTWLSMEFFDENAHKLPAEAASIAADNIKTACERFNLAPSKAVLKTAKEASSNVYFEKEGAIHKVSIRAEADLSKIAMVQQIGDNYTAAQYAMASPSHVKVAAGYLEQHEKDMPAGVRHKYAAAIQRRAHELGMPAIKGTTGKYASDHYSPMIDAHIGARASLLDGRPEMKATIQKLGSAKKQYTPSQFAQLLSGFDKQAGLSRYYGSHLTDPFQATFASQPDPYAGFRYKSAAASDLGGEDIKKIATMYHKKIAEHLGPHIADEFRREPVAIFDSLPRDAKELIAGMLDGTV